MPNRTTHLIIGGIAGAVTNAVMQASYITFNAQQKFDWCELCACAVAGSLAGVVPDILEPANSPNHRGFFHSVVIGVAVAYAMTGKHTTRWPRVVTVLAAALGAGYLSHLAADACTPKSIDLI